MIVELHSGDRPFLPRGVRIHRDEVRGTEVLLAPEKAILLDVIGVAILSRVNGKNTVKAIIGDLCVEYDAPHEQIRADVMNFLGSLRSRMFLGIVS